MRTIEVNGAELSAFAGLVAACERDGIQVGVGVNDFSGEILIAGRRAGLHARGGRLECHEPAVLGRGDTLAGAISMAQDLLKLNSGKVDAKVMY